MPSFSAYNALGTTIETSEITDSSITKAKLNFNVDTLNEIASITASGITSSFAFTSLGLTEGRYLIKLSNLNMTANYDMYFTQPNSPANGVSYWSTPSTISSNTSRFLKLDKYYNASDCIYIDIFITSSASNKFTFLASFDGTCGEFHQHSRAFEYIESVTSVDNISLFGNYFADGTICTLYEVVQ